MAFKAYKPYGPDFRTVFRSKNGTVDPPTIPKGVPTKQEIYKSIYSADFSNGQDQVDNSPHQLRNDGAQVNGAQKSGSNLENPTLAASPAKQSKKHKPFNLSSTEKSMAG